MKINKLTESEREFLGDLLKKQFEIASKTNFERVKEFHKAFKDYDPVGLHIPSDDVIELRAKLIYEEFMEVLAELKDAHLATSFAEDEPKPTVCIDPFAKISHAKLAKELCDLLYVVYGCAAKFGIPIDECFAEVHRSNMSKLGPDGKPILREDGKILKSNLYVPPDLDSILYPDES